MLEDCQYTSIGILGSDCLSDSVDSLNQNYFNISTALCDISATIDSQHLKLQSQNVNVGGGNGTDTYTINFSGFGVDVYNDPPNQRSRKTVFVPLTGLFSVAVAPTRIDRKLLYPQLEVVSYNNPVSYKGQRAGEGNVTIRVACPPPPKQVRTFFYQGPSAATSPTDKMDTGKNTYPSHDTINSFVNSLGLNVPTISRNFDEVWVIYQKHGYKTKQDGGYTVPAHTHYYENSITIPEHYHTVQSTSAPIYTVDGSSGDHRHSVGDIPKSGTHNHSSNWVVICGKGQEAGSMSAAGAHGHTLGGSTTAGGNHTHKNSETYPAGYTYQDVKQNTNPSQYLDDSGNVSGNTYTVPPETIDRYIPITVIYKCIYDEANTTYKSSTVGFPKFIQATGKDTSDWSTPQKWATY